MANSVFQREDGSDAVFTGVMTIENKKGAVRQREFHLFQRDGDDGVSTTMIRFRAPANIEGTALLDDPSQDGVWLYLPALDRVRRISSSNRGGRFVNSQLYYEDLRDRHPDEDKHELLGNAEYEGIEALKLQSTPLEDESSAYSKRVSWIHPELRIPLRVDFYEGGEQPSKRLLVKRVDEIQGYWTVTLSVMTDLEKGDATTLAVEGVKYNQALPEDLFRTSSLKVPASGAAYLP